MKYIVMGNNRGSYDILKDDNGDFCFIAEVMNEDNANSFADLLNTQSSLD